MEAKDYLKDIQDIKSMMANSSQFLSLSGLSGILAGVYSLIGAFLANNLLSSYSGTNYKMTRITSPIIETEITNQLFLIAICVIALSILTGLTLSARKAKKQGETLWNISSRKLIINFGIPLLTGGIFALIQLLKQDYVLIAPITLLFYGLGCVNASKNTFRDVRYLGITMVILGLISTYYSGFGLLFWTLGFGICHILYGSIMYFKYDRN